MSRAGSAAAGVAAVVLAAGAGTRMGPGPPKLLRTWHGEPLVRRAVRIACASGCRPVFVVLGAHASGLAAALEGLDVRHVACADWRDGMSASIRAGVRAVEASAPEARAVAVVLADQVGVEASHLDALIARFERADAVVATAHSGGLGAPAVFPRRHFDALLRLRGDRGARAWLEANAPTVERVPCESAALDVDTPADLARASGA